MRAPAAVEEARSTTFPDDVKGDLNQALVSLGSVLHTLVLFRFLCFDLVVVIFILLPSDWLEIPILDWLTC